MADIIDLKFVTDTTDLDKAVTKATSLEKRIVKLAKEVATGRITSDQYTKAVKKSATELQKLSGLGIRARKSVYDYSTSVYQAATASNKAAASTDNYSGSLNQLSTSSIGATSSLDMLSRQAHQTKNKMNANGMAMQQAGYQVGDFIVQVQSGTNVWVAAGQQLTQLTGVLGMMNPAWIGMGAALGILVPLVTAVGAAFSRSKSNADNLTTTLDELENAYSEIKSINDTLEVQLVGTWAAASEGADNYLRKLRDVTQESARAAGEDVLTRDAGILAQFKADLLGGDDTSGIVSQMDKTIQDLLDKRQVLIDRITDPLIGQKGRDRKFAELFPEASRLLELANRYKDERQEFLNVFAKGTTTEESVIRILALREKYEKSGGDAMLKRIDGIISELKLEGEITAYRKKQDDAQKKAQEEEAERLRKLSEQELMLGEQITSVQRKDAEDALAQQLTDSEELESYKLKMFKLFRENANRIHAEDMEAQAEADTKRFDELFKIRTLDYKLRFVGEENVMGQSVTASKGKMKPTQSYEELIALGMSPEEIENLFGIKPPRSKKGTKPKTMEGPIKALERQIELSKALFGLEGEERRRKEVFMQLEFQNRDLLKQYQEDPARLQAIADEVAAQEKVVRVLEEQREVQKEVADTIANSMGDALMSMVDGTKSVKDAFKDMARVIIAELYRIYVVKKITGMISGAIMGPAAAGGYFGSAGGIGGGSGATIAYADGGVVGSPTTFPMAGGRTGLMGEAGPEAIMPLKRGKDGKLGVQAEGGSGDVIIHQNFNFQANGDESVKKIIAQQAPAIANMTKKQILDDRRRGGQMKQAFG